MNSQDISNFLEAYLDVYQELDEVTGRGRIDPVSDFPHHGERGSRSPKDAGLKMSPIDRAEARANALRKRKDPEATKRANRIQSRFVGPTKRGLGRAINASNVARSAEKRRLMNSEELNIYETDRTSGSNKTTYLPKSRERNIGRHNDWTDKPLEWGERPEAGKKLKRRLNAVVGTRRREDKEVGMREDVYDIVLSHLLNEGYAETPEAAEAILINMSEKWVEDILDETPEA